MERRTVAYPNIFASGTEPVITRILARQNLLDKDIAFCRNLDQAQWRLLQQMIDKRINSPLASSAGRLFDAVAAVLGLRCGNAYEGQAAIMVEAAATEAEGTYNYAIHDAGDLMVMDPAPMFAGIVADLQASVDIGTIAARFHNTFVAMLAETNPTEREMRPP